MGLYDFWKRPQVCRPIVLLQQLEERIVLDAAVVEPPPVHQIPEPPPPPLPDAGPGDSLPISPSPAAEHGTVPESLQAPGLDFEHATPDSLDLPAITEIDLLIDGTHESILTPLVHQTMPDGSTVDSGTVDVNGDGTADGTYSATTHQVQNGVVTSIELQIQESGSEQSYTVMTALKDTDGDGDYDVSHEEAMVGSDGQMLYYHDHYYDEQGRLTMTDEVQFSVAGDATGVYRTDYYYGDDGLVTGASTVHYDTEYELTLADYTWYNAEGKVVGFEHVDYSIDNQPFAFERTTYTYDEQGLLDSFDQTQWDGDGQRLGSDHSSYNTDANGNVISLDRTHFGADYQMAGTDHATYDLSGHMTGLDHQDYDALGNITVSAHTTFDQDGHAVANDALVYDSDGHVIGQTQTTYDALGRATVIANTSLDVNGSVIGTDHTDFHYDAEGYLVSSDKTSFDDQGRQIATNHTVYDALGRQTSVDHTSFDAMSAVVGTELTTFTYDTKGLVTATDTMDYDPQGILTAKAHTSLTYDDQDHVIDVAIQRYDGQDRMTTADHTTYDSYGNTTSTDHSIYDAAGHISTEQHTTYDVNGRVVTWDITTYDADGHKTAVDTRTYNADGHEITKDHTTFDATGNVTARDHTEYVYDSAGNLVVMTTAHYDAGNNLVGEDITTYHYENGQLADSVTTHFDASGAMTGKNATVYSCDAEGRPISSDVTHCDAAGLVVGTDHIVFNYTADGMPLDQTTTIYDVNGTVVDVITTAVLVPPNSLTVHTAQTGAPTLTMVGPQITNDSGALVGEPGDWFQASGEGLPWWMSWLFTPIPDPSKAPAPQTSPPNPNWSPLDNMRNYQSAVASTALKLGPQSYPGTPGIFARNNAELYRTGDVGKYGTNLSTQLAVEVATGKLGEAVSRTVPGEALPQIVENAIDWVFKTLDAKSQTQNQVEQKQGGSFRAESMSVESMAEGTGVTSYQADDDYLGNNLVGRLIHLLDDSGNEVAAIYLDFEDNCIFVGSADLAGPIVFSAIDLTPDTNTVRDVLTCERVDGQFIFEGQFFDSNGQVTLSDCLVLDSNWNEMSHVVWDYVGGEIAHATQWTYSAAGVQTDVAEWTIDANTGRADVYTEWKFDSAGKPLSAAIIKSDPHTGAVNWVESWDLTSADEMKNHEIRYLYDGDWIVWKAQGSRGDCPIVAQAEVIETLTGWHLDMEEVLQYATQQGYYSVQFDVCWADRIGELVEDYGLQQSGWVDNVTFQDLQTAVDQGQGVLVAMDSQYLSSPPTGTVGSHVSVFLGFGTIDGTEYAVLNNGWEKTPPVTLVPIETFAQAFWNSAIFVDPPGEGQTIELPATLPQDVEPHYPVIVELPADAHPDPVHDLAAHPVDLSLGSTIDLHGDGTLSLLTTTQHEQMPDGTIVDTGTVDVNGDGEADGTFVSTTHQEGNTVIISTEVTVTEQGVQHTYTVVRTLTDSDGDGLYDHSNEQSMGPDGHILYSYGGSYDLQGRLATSYLARYDGTDQVAGAERVDYEYDADGRIATATHTLFDGQNHVTAKNHTDYQYNTDGTLNSADLAHYDARYHQTATVHVVYDSLGRVLSTDDTHYDDQGQVTGTDHTEYRYNYELLAYTVRTHYDDPYHKTDEWVTYYDSNKLVTQVAHSQYYDTLHTPNKDIVYYYDNGQMKSEIHEIYDRDGLVEREQITYDQNGNVTGGFHYYVFDRDDQGNRIDESTTYYGANKVATYTVAYHYHNHLRVASEDLTNYYFNGQVKDFTEKLWDDQGHFLSKVQTAYTYDGELRLTVAETRYFDDAGYYVTGKDITSYAYDEQGNTQGMFHNTYDAQNNVTGIDTTVRMLEDGAYVLTATDLGFIDSLGHTINGYVSAKITQLEGAGSLTLSGAEVTLDQLVTRADIDAGHLLFTPAADANGTDYASFEFAPMNDSGVNIVQGPNAVTFNVTAVNDEPVADPQAITANVNEVVRITLTGSTGPADESGQILRYVIDSVPSNGALYADLSDAQNGINDLPAGHITNPTVFYRSSLDDATDTSFTFHIWDNGVITDEGDNTSPSAIVNITVEMGNGTPTDIALSNYSVAENLPAGTTVGTLSTTDPDAGDTHTYTLVTGDGDEDNDSFIMDGDQLKTAAVFDHEAQSSYSIRVRTTDLGGLFYDEVLAIQVSSANEAPTDINLTNATVAENEPIGTVVGSFTTTDPDSGDTHTYSLVAGTGDTDNASFTVEGGILKTAAVLNFEAQNSYSILVRTTDGGGLFFDKAFPINLSDVNEAPVAVDQGASGNEDAVFRLLDASGWDSAFQDVDQGLQGTPLELVITDTINLHGSLTYGPGGQAVGSTIAWADLPNVFYKSDTDFNGAASLAFKVRDASGAANNESLNAATMSIVVNPVNDEPVANPQAITTNVNEVVQITLAGNPGPANESGQILSYFIDSLPSNGSLYAGLSDAQSGINALAAGAILSADMVWYKSAVNDATDTSFTFHVQDDGGTSNGGVDTSASETVTVNVASGNQAPEAADFAISVNEDAAVRLTGWKFTDAEGDAAQSIKFTDLPDDGIVFLDANTNGTVDSGEAIVLNQVISWADAKTAPIVKYLGNQNYSGSDSLQYVVIDSAGSEGMAPADAGTVTITVNARNDAPVNMVPVAQAVDEDTPLVFSTATGNAIAISDVDAGTGPVRVQLTATHGILTLSGTTGLSFTVGADGTASMTFTGTMADINEALDGMSFTPNSDYSGAATVRIVTNDQGNTGAGGAKSDSDTVAVTVNTVQDNPVARDFAITANEDVARVISGWNLTDVDRDVATAIRIVGLSTHGMLFLDANTNGTVDSGEAIVLNQVISWADAKTAPIVKYLGNQNYSGSDSLQYVVIDAAGSEGMAPADAGTVTITVNARNDAPVNMVPVAQAVDEDTPLVFSTATGNAIAISDVDAGTGPVRVQLTATHGILTLSGTTGLSFTAGADGTASMTFTGTMADINEALDGMSFTPNSDYSGAAMVRIVTNDQGNTGAGGAKSDSDTVAVTVNTVNDAPVNTVPVAQTAHANQTLVFSALGGNAISISDTDAGSNQVQVTLTATDGTLTLARRSGLTFSLGDGVSDVTMTFVGKLSAINAALNGLKFDPSVLSGEASIRVQSNDFGAIGFGEPLGDDDTVAINVVNP